MLLEVQIFHDITQFRLGTGVSENVITLETSLNIDKFTILNFPEILIFIFKLFFTYVLVMFFFLFYIGAIFKFLYIQII